MTRQEAKAMRKKKNKLTQNDQDMTQSWIWENREMSMTEDAEGI